MRRSKPASSISPQQLKHFAGAAVVLTTLMALIAAGEDPTSSVQVDANRAKAELVDAQQTKLGTKKLASNLRVRGDGSGGFGADEGGDGGFASDGGGGGGPRSGSPSRPIPPQQGAAALPQHTPDGKASKKRMRKPGDPGHDGRSGGATESQGAGSGSGGPPDMSQMAAVREASRQRSGSAEANGD